MKYFIYMWLLALSLSATANDCTPPEEFSSGHYLGYLAFAEKAPDPVLMWWRDECDDALEPDGRFIGVETLSKKKVFQSARKILKKKKRTPTFLLGQI